MRIGLLTFHSAYNYGAVLQCYALTRIINESGHQCETIDYRPRYFWELYNMTKTFSLTHPPIKTWLKHLKVRGILKAKNHNFEKFIRENIPLSEKTFNTEDELNDNISDYDMLITGSDQVWNDRCASFDPVYFANFPAAQKMRKASYAASFGFNQVPEALANEYKKRLASYNCLSVREENGMKIINDLIHREATVCCDPTLLLTKEQWEDIVENNTYDEPYILIYYVNKTQKLQQYAQQIAMKYGYKIICVPCNMDINVITGKNDNGLVDQTIIDCSPQQFISLIKNAEMVLTNSFHGTVFSIIFEKYFWVDLQINATTYNHRAEALLKRLHIQHEDIQTFIDKKTTINWNTVKNELQTLREHGIKYLESIYCYK